MALRVLALAEGLSKWLRPTEPQFPRVQGESPHVVSGGSPGALERQEQGPGVGTSTCAPGARRGQPRQGGRRASCCATSLRPHTPPTSQGSAARPPASCGCACRAVPFALRALASSWNVLCAHTWRLTLCAASPVSGEGTVSRVPASPRPSMCSAPTPEGLSAEARAQQGARSPSDVQARRTWLPAAWLL